MVEPAPTPAGSAGPAQPPMATAGREVVGLFHDIHAMEQAVHDLLSHGFDRSLISFLANDRQVRDKLGHRIEDTIAVADNPAVPKRTYVEPESRVEATGALASVLGYLGAVTAVALTFASGGAAAVAIGGAVIGAGAGAGLGAALGQFFDRRLSNHFEEQIAKGGILIWVACRDADWERDAHAILDRHGANHIHTLDHPPAGG